MQLLQTLLQEYSKAPEIYHATRYWEAYEQRIVKEIERADLAQLRSGKYPIFATFGFNENIYHYRHDISWHKKLNQKLIRKYFIGGKSILPYNLRLKDIREMAYRHADVLGQAVGAKPISDIEASSFGNPQDLFEI